MLQKLFQLLILILCAVNFILGQFPFLGKCPSPDVQENFDVERFFGTWYEIERTMSFLEIGSQCVLTNFSRTSYGDGSIEVINVGKGPVLKLPKSIRFVAKVPNENETAKMKLRISDLSLKTNYWILSTDYDNYALIWACNHIWLTFQFARTENMWILSRERILPKETLDQIHERIDKIKSIKAKKLLHSVNQKNCD